MVSSMHVRMSANKSSLSSLLFLSLSPLPHISRHGLSVGGSLPIIFPYIAEFTRNKYRGPYLGAQAFFWTFGRLVSGGIAWIILPLSIQSTYVHSWRLYIAISAVPALIGALLYLLLPESPRFLLEVREREWKREGIER